MPASISEYVPQFVTGDESARRGRAAWAAWGLMLAATAGWIGLIVAAPLLKARGEVVWSQTAYMVFRAACHQMPERSFYVAGFPLAVCARCFGLYVGGLLGIVLYPLARPVTKTDAPERVWLLLAVLPTTIDFALGFFGVWENTHWSRFLTALVAGAATAFYIVPGLVDVSLTGVRRPGSRRRAVV